MIILEVRNHRKGIQEHNLRSEQNNTSFCDTIFIWRKRSPVEGALNSPALVKTKQKVI